MPCVTPLTRRPITIASVATETQRFIFRGYLMVHVRLVVRAVLTALVSIGAVLHRVHAQTVEVVRGHVRSVVVYPWLMQRCAPVAETG